MYNLRSEIYSYGPPAMRTLFGFHAQGEPIRLAFQAIFCYPSHMVRELNGNRLNSSQLAFAQGVADGQTQLESYRSAYPKSSPRSARANSSRLIEKPEIASYVGELREKTETSQTFTRQQKRELLAGIARDDSMPWGARLRAIDLDSRLAGHYEPEKVERKFSVVIG